MLWQGFAGRALATESVASGRPCAPLKCTGHIVDAVESAEREREQEGLGPKDRL